ncbi:allophanate hydrolase subunit 1 [Limnobacter thiooxidans]|uniref:5-oxoprolinase subunit B family protein n=1 Tax=Limnobacter thiooxidans TaxID=131080 RepID=UPI0030C73040
MTPIDCMPNIYCVSDRAIQIDWTSQPVNPAMLAQALGNHPAALSLPRFQCIQADRSITLVFESSILPALLYSLKQAFIDSLGSEPAQTSPLIKTGQHHLVPVQYGGAAGQDLDWIAAQTGLSAQAVIDLHCSAVYTVQFLGFLPGFAYLTGLPKPLQIPRRSHPRAHVPAGTLAIGAEYCAVYPWSSPGGWHLIGHVEQRMFDPFGSDETGQSFFQVGDVVQFVRAEQDA